MINTNTKIKFISFILVIVFIIIYLMLSNVISKEFIMELEARFYIILIFVTLLMGYVLKEDMKKVLKKYINKSTLIVIIFLFILAVTLRVSFPPKTHRLFFDEDIYMDMAKQILVMRKSCLCDYGNAFQCYECELMKWPVGHPFMLALFFFIFGISNMVATYGMIFLNSLSCVLLFLASLLIFKNKNVALFSSFVLAISPIQILWSPTTSADMSYVFFITLLLFFLSLSMHSKRLNMLSPFILGLSIQVKPEAIILIFLYFLFQFSIKDFLVNKRYIVFITIVMLLSAPYFLHIFKELATNPWGAENIQKISITHIPKNFVENALYFFEAYITTPMYNIKQLYHPILFTLLAILGTICGFKKHKKHIFIILISFFSILFLYSSFYAGSVLWGVDVRYMLPLYPFFSILVGLGCNYLTKQFNINSLMLVFLLFIYFSFYIPLISIPAENIEEAYSARFYRKFAVSFAKRYPENCYFISHVTSLYSVLGKGHMQIWYVYKNEFDQMIKDKDCIIFDKGFWCGIKGDESKTCTILTEKYKSEEIESIIDTKRNVKYTFYNIKN